MPRKKRCGCPFTRTPAGRPAPDPAELPIDALRGVSEADAEAIRKAFGVKTIRQLAEHKFIRAAQAFTLLAGAK